MLKALGLGKNKAPSEEQIQKHRERRNIRAQWEHDVTRSRNILLKLECSYQTHKGTFALRRYKELKSMIKQTLQDYAAMKPEHESWDDAKLAAVRSRYSGKGATTRLVQSSRDFADNLKRIAEEVKYYSEKTSKDIDAELYQFRRDIFKFKQVFRTERDKLDRLASDYEASKRYNPIKRYGILKNLIKTITRDLSVPTSSASRTG